MSIRLRLLLSNIAMIIIPLLIFALFSGFLILVFFNDIKGLAIDSGSGDNKYWFQSVQDSFNKRNELTTGIKFVIDNDPDRLTDKSFIAKIDEQLNRLRAGLAVVVKDQVFYASPVIDSSDLFDKLRHIELNRSGQQLNGEFMAERHDFKTGNDLTGSVYILTDSTQFLVLVEKFFPAILFALAAAIALANGLLTYLVSRSIIKPLFELKRAAEHIRQGDLEQELRVTRKDEIGKLGAAFEEMRKRLKDSIQLQLHYEENRKELVSSISHDLKTPITGIKACVEGIFDGIADTDEKRNKYLHMIHRKATDMDRMIEELFLFSKLDLKRLPFHLTNIDIVDFLRDYVEQLRLDPRMQGISSSLRYDAEHPIYVSADTEKLHRVMMNIVENSMKYMQAEPRVVQIGLDVAEDEVTISIADNGAGMDQEAIPHIFDRFYRAEPSRSSITGGSGLGLAIVKQIIEAHGGKVWAESKIGHGTLISFTLRKTAGSEGEPS